MIKVVGTIDCQGRPMSDSRCFNSTRKIQDYIIQGSISGALFADVMRELKYDVRYFIRNYSRYYSARLSSLHSLAPFDDIIYRRSYTAISGRPAA